MTAPATSSAITSARKNMGIDIQMKISAPTLPTATDRHNVSD